MAKKLSPRLTRLLLIRGIARALAPVAVLWGIWDWWQVDWIYALIFAALSFNYVIVYALSWIAPAAQNGPWRIRPWQTFILFINAFVLPIAFYRTQGSVPWGFIAVTFLFFVGLYAGMAIMLHLYRSMPMANFFAAQKGATFAGLIQDETDPTQTKSKSAVAS